MKGVNSRRGENDLRITGPTAAVSQLQRRGAEETGFEISSRHTRPIGRCRNETMFLKDIYSQRGPNVDNEFKWQSRLGS